MIPTFEFKSDHLDQLFFLRQAWRNREDLLKLRISAGNRLCAIFRDRFPEDMKAVHMLDNMSRSYNFITSNVAQQLSSVEEQNKQAKKQAKKKDKDEEPKKKKKKPTIKMYPGSSDIIMTAEIFALPPKEVLGEEKLYIHNFHEYLLLDNYKSLERAEKIQQDNLAKLLAGIPIFEKYLINIKGIDIVCSAFLISEIDIHKCTYPSQLHAFFGLHASHGMATIKGNWNKTVEDEEGVGHKIGVLSFSVRNVDSGKSIFIGKMRDWDMLKLKEDKIDLARSRKHVSLVEDHIDTSKWRVIYKDVDTNITFDKSLYQTADQADAINLEVARLKALEKAKTKGKKKVIIIEDEDEDVEDGYTERKNKKQTEDYIAAERTLGYKSELQGKLKGALVTPLRCHNVKYNGIIKDYKTRFAAMPEHAEKTPGHIQAMAVTRMLKLFLTDLYVAWRTLEGLPVAVPYEEAKLGIKHGTGQNTLPPMGGSGRIIDL